MAQKKIITGLDVVCHNSLAQMGVFWLSGCNLHFVQLLGDFLTGFRVFSSPPKYEKKSPKTVQNGVL